MKKKILTLLLATTTFTFFNLPALSATSEVVNEKGSTNVDYQVQSNDTKFLSEDIIYLARRDRDRDVEDVSTGDRNPAWILNIFIPGLSQMLMGKPMQGIGFMLASIILTPLFGLGLIFWIWSIVDGYDLAGKQM